ncbi:hypothetical protein HZC30_02725 [Candidatus Woesearchaeota archaeon]|nr:hypothetical protein [Candidatus Woesearchaeota archaeon]
MEKEIRKSLSPLDIAATEREVKKNGKLIDLIITTKKGVRILLGLKSSGEPSYIYKAISQLKLCQPDKNEYLMVAAPSISEKSKEICKSSGVGYIDLRGNVFVKYGDVLIEKVQSAELPKIFLPAKKRVKDLFSGDSLRVLTKILNKPSRSFTQEEITNQLNLSKAYVNRILKTLEDGIKEDGDILLVKGPDDKDLTGSRLGVQIIGEFEWIDTPPNKKIKMVKIRKTKKYLITNPQKLLDIFAKKYNFNESTIVSFYSFEKDAQKLMEKISQASHKNKLDYAFTLHAGTSLSAPLVRFEDVYFYINKDDLQKWESLLDLKKTEFGGNVFVVIPKYEWILKDKIKINKKKVVNNIILYLDLINYPKRGKEQAEFLREKKIGY